ncbi:hypothetical protein [Cohnella sp. REN36]|uniref:hypothetical protein n=1 Tax=Cohnella sp. REN36 TaxID=2887347 RepID=UPI001D14936A|nr:hypothetical protein [Cohnella sp. REN36]MCC3375042.1 hypothetical protein [Cohnella sp. REN36]
MTAPGTGSVPGFVPKPLGLPFEVSHPISLHYFEFAKDFTFRGERRDLAGASAARRRGHRQSRQREGLMANP